MSGMRSKAARVNLVSPNEPQKEFLSAEERFIAYGGARGGGKSEAVRIKAVLLAFAYAGIKILFLRRTYPELRENHILPLKKLLGQAAAYKEVEKSFNFPNGSRIVFGYCDNEQDVLRYQGQEYDIAFIDEATQLTEFQFDTLKACIRGANDFPKRMYLTCNPGGVGHAWVKRLFVDRQYRKDEDPSDFKFIRASVYDNKALMEKDPGYVKMLESLPEDLRRAWLEGDWDVFAGQFFREFRRDKHVCEPFVIPQHWKRYFALDYGLDMFAGLWAAFDEEGRCYVYREAHSPEMKISDAAAKIRSHDSDEITAYFAPPDLWGRSADTGKSQAERYAEEGVFLSKVNANRIAGWLEVKEWLAGDRPRLQIFSNCENLIRCLPLLQHDQHDPNDCAKEPHEITHITDALRYLIAGRPGAAVVEKEDPFTPKYTGDEELWAYGLEDDGWNF